MGSGSDSYERNLMVRRARWWLAVHSPVPIGKLGESVREAVSRGDMPEARRRARALAAEVERAVAESGGLPELAGVPMSLKVIACLSVGLFVATRANALVADGAGVLDTANIVMVVVAVAIGVLVVKFGRIVKWLAREVFVLRIVRERARALAAADEKGGL